MIGLAIAFLSAKEDDTTTEHWLAIDYYYTHVTEDLTQALEIRISDREEHGNAIPAQHPSVSQTTYLYTLGINNCRKQEAPEFLPHAL